VATIVPLTTCSTIALLRTIARCMANGGEVGVGVALSVDDELADELVDAPEAPPAVATVKRPMVNVAATAAGVRRRRSLTTAPRPSVG
jgi:hypothetical protein